MSVQLFLVGATLRSLTSQCFNMLLLWNIIRFIQIIKLVTNKGHIQHMQKQVCLSFIIQWSRGGYVRACFVAGRAKFLLIFQIGTLHWHTAQYKPHLNLSVSLFPEHYCVSPNHTYSRLSSLICNSSSCRSAEFLPVLGVTVSGLLLYQSLSQNCF